MHDYYMKRQKSIKKTYSKMTKWAEKILIAYLKPEEVNLILDDVKLEADQIISRLPYIGGRKNAFSNIIEMNGWFIAFYKASSKHGFDAVMASYINYKVSIKFFDQVPRLFRRPIGRLAFTSLGKSYFRRQALESQKEKFEEDFIYTFDAADKSCRFEFKECAVQKFYESEGVEELKHFCNFADPIYSKLFGMGCDASHSLATGFNTCILDYELNRETKLPDNVEEMIQMAEEKLLTLT
ncbi:hypothetical protein EZV73_21210 [Acidaminobacter sp. JC074]|uniref:hypothetical protein n=1 Tax=Acidaminobacter sp. JC074 TaxID=2530199 RepID=UPI001F0CE071|nr:hypothetical protein [Acidaminobacter sp. JC074]MCH4890113.1 hypothetical protein [Acidaminobacter sp. JC074]